MIRNRFYDILIIANSILIVLSLIYFNNSNIDIQIQDLLFDIENKKWLTDKDELVKKLFFYNLPKILLGILIAFLFASLTFFRKKNFACKYRKQIILLLAGITIIPLIAGNIKNFTNIYCPNQLGIYGGDYPYVKIFDSYPKDFIQTKKGRCFPAGHAVTGFCLMILFFVYERKLYRILGLFFAIILGWVLGLYQMAKGAHFLSDTLISMLVCFLLATIIAKLFYLKYNFPSKH